MDDQLRTFASIAGMLESLEGGSWYALEEDLDRFACILLNAERSAICSLLDAAQIPKTEAERLKKMIMELT